MTTLFNLHFPGRKHNPISSPIASNYPGMILVSDLGAKSLKKGIIPEKKRENCSIFGWKMANRERVLQVTFVFWPFDAYPQFFSTNFSNSFDISYINDYLGIEKSKIGPQMWAWQRFSHFQGKTPRINLGLFSQNYIKYIFQPELARPSQNRTE